MDARIIDLVKRNQVGNNDVLFASKIIGIQAAKSTSYILPTSQDTLIINASISYSIFKNFIMAECISTGTNKEATETSSITGTSACLISIYHQCKHLDSRIVISNVQPITIVKPYPSIIESVPINL